MISYHVRNRNSTILFYINRPRGIDFSQSIADTHGKASHHHPIMSSSLGRYILICKNPTSTSTSHRRHPKAAISSPSIYYHYHTYRPTKHVYLVINCKIQDIIRAKKKQTNPPPLFLFFSFPFIS